MWWVDLGSVVAGRVTASIARTLAVPEVPGRAPADLVVARLRESRALLVLDNCEHVRPEVAGFAAHALEGDPHARILGTSREPLRVAGERVHPLAGLHAPVAERLFVERAPVAVATRRGRRRGRAPRRAAAGDRARRRRAAVRLARGARGRPARAAGAAGRRAAARAAAPAHARGRDRLELRPADARPAGGPAAPGGVPRQLRRRAGRTRSRATSARSPRARWWSPSRAATGCCRPCARSRSPVCRRRASTTMSRGAIATPTSALAEVVELNMLGPGLPEWLPREPPRARELRRRAALVARQRRRGRGAPARRHARLVLVPARASWPTAASCSSGRCRWRIRIARRGRTRSSALSWIATGAAAPDALAITDAAVAACEGATTTCWRRRWPTARRR